MEMMRCEHNPWKIPFKDGFQSREEKLTLDIKIIIIVVNIYWAVVMCKWKCLSCPTLCDSMDPMDYTVHGIFRPEYWSG